MSAEHCLQCEAGELAGVTRARQARPLSACTHSALVCFHKNKYPLVEPIHCVLGYCDTKYGCATVLVRIRDLLHLPCGLPFFYPQSIRPVKNSFSYCRYFAFSPYCMDQKCARKGLAQPQAWHAGDVSASPEQGEAREQAGVAREQQARPLSACICT